jgi:YidC/Oxa1 family membrane protein insertase
MDNKRVIIAVVLSMVVLIGWNWIFPPAPPQAPPEVRRMEEPVQPPAPPSAQRPQIDAGEAFSPTEGRRLTVNTPEYLAVINTAGGILERFELKNYRESLAPGASAVNMIKPQALVKAPLGIIWGQTATWREAEWGSESDDMTLQLGQEAKLVIQGKLGDLLFTRELTFTAGSYLVREDLRVRNGGEGRVVQPLSFTLAGTALSPEDSRYDTTSVAYYLSDSLEKENDLEDLGKGIESPQAVQWGAIESNYFLMSVVPQDAAVFKGKYEDEVYRIALNEDVALEPGAEATLTSSYYLGPKKDQFLENAPNNLQAAINYGWFNFIAKPLITVLNFFYGYVGNYGVAIIILTIIIKILFWPLSHKSYKSMESMKKLQPMMAKIREKHKDDRQKMNQEMMQLYKTYKVNPAGGCLPMLLQIPVFFALYQALMGAIELRHAPFIATVPFTDIVWLADLSAKDPFYITPIVMGATMFLQQKMTPAPGDPMQAKIMLFLPVIFTFLFLSFPSGLVVYWLVNNVLSIFQQWMIGRKSQTPPVKAPKEAQATNK